MSSEFIANRDPSIVQVVAATEDLQVVPIGHQSLNDLIDFLRLLRLASPLTKDNVCFNTSLQSLAKIPFISYQASLLRVLQIITMALRDLPINRLFDPGQFIDLLVSKFMIKVKCKLVLVVDHPNEQESVCLEFDERNNIQDVLVGQGVIRNGNTSGWIGTGEHPWRVDRDHIEKLV